MDSGVSWTLPRLVGAGRATALALLAEPITSEAALEMGLVNAAVEDDHLLPAAHELAARLAAGPTAAYAAIKQSIAYAATRDARRRPGQGGRAAGRRWRHTEDHRNATAAFVAKQQPVYVGR